jgi:antirestriction protein ArdC
MSKYSSAKLQKSIHQTIEELANLIDKAQFSEEIEAYLDTVDKFHHYSFHNQLLIHDFFPTASHVAGFCTWRDKFNRKVRRGEKGIPILAPIRVSKSPLDKQESQDDDEEREVKLFFKVVYVFDISQTEGDDIPQLDVWKSLEARPELQNKLIAYAQSLGLSVEITNLGSAQGSLNSDHQILLDKTAGTKTLVHEIAHHLAGHLGSEISHEQRELEAEATAYVVCRHIGFEDLKSPNYLYLSGLRSEDLSTSLATISSIAQQIIKNIEED